MSERKPITAEATGAFTPTPEPIQVTSDHSSSRTATADKTLLPEIPGYDVIRELGRGGMGAVYEAHSKNLNRRVALKIVLGGAVAGSNAMRRFLAEAEALAALQHPSIVQVYDRGEYQGLPFFTMEFCPGQTLTDRVKDQPLPPREAAALVEQLAHAVAAAHACGILHRDLKPDNVLFSLDGAPKIADFGLAKRFDDSSGDSPAAGVTVTGAVMGTPSYMAPEQAKGDTKNVGPAADVYALGAILYRLVAGRPPFQGANPADTIRQVIDSEPTNPRTFVDTIPRDLATICLKCLAKEPTRRFTSANDLAAELRRFLNNEPILTRRVGTAERVFLWARRRPTAAAAWALTILAIIFGSAGGVAVWQWRSADAARGEAKEAQQKAEDANANLDEQKRLAEEAKYWAQQDRLRFEGLLAKEREPIEKIEHQLRKDLDISRQKLQSGFYPRQIELAFHYWQSGEPALARQVLGECSKSDRGWEFGYVDQLVNGCKFPMPGGGVGRVDQLAFSPDGKRVAFRTGSITICDFPSTQNVVRIPLHTEWLGFTADGKRLVATIRGGVAIYDAASGKELHKREGIVGDWGIRAGAFDPTGDRLACIQGGKASVKVVGLDDGKEVFALPGHQDRHRAVAWSPDGKWIATADQSGWRLWDAAKGKPIRAVGCAVGYDNGLAFSPDSTRLACIEGATASVWEVPSGKHICQGASSKSWAHCVAFSADGKQIVTGGLGNEVVVSDAKTGQLLRTYRGLPRTMQHVACDPSGRYVAALDRAGNAALWEFAIHDGAREIGIGNEAATAEFDAKTGNLFVASPSRLKIVDPATGAKISEHKLTPPTGDVTIAGFGPRGGRLSLLSNDGWSVVDTVEGFKTRKWTRPAGEIWHVAFAADEKRLVLSGKNLSIRDAATGVELVNCPGHSGDMGPVALSPDDKWLAVADRAKNIVSIRDVTTGKQAHEIHAYFVEALAFGDGGKILAVATSDHGQKSDDVVLYDTRNWAELRRLPHYGYWANMLAFSADGRRLATAGWNTPISIWDVKSGARVLTLSGRNGGMRALSFSSDGRWLVSASGDHSVRLWDGGSNATISPEKKP